MHTLTDQELIEKAERSIDRLKISDARVTEIQDGVATICCSKIERNDKQLILVALRLLPGIESVTFVTS
ncbi:hypothetical protein [Rubripirellula reticaptiva]|uniref:hypothetical protein n=1 Tax=Rubripirellula reticaptiva TaxID=2528013 RepID=UPI0011B3F344|nr:hypothetical protein [Rubripirellula reticaptiva]